MVKSLSERLSVSQAPITAAAVVTAQDIVAAGGKFEVDLGAAYNVALYVGFPVVVQIEDEEVAAGKTIIKRGAGAEAYLSTVPMGHYRIARPVRRLAFTAPAGFGGTAESEFYGRHGSIIIIASNPDDLTPLAVNPDMLPTHTARFNVTLGAASTSINTTVADNVWNVGNATPAVIWLKYINVCRFLPATGAPTGSVHEFTISKNNIPAGDVEYIFAANGLSSILSTFSLPNVEVTPKAIFDAFGASAGDIAIGAVYDSQASATTLQVNLLFAYML